MQAPQVLLLGNDATRDGAHYSVVDAHAGRQIADGELDMRVSQVPRLRSRPSEVIAG